MHKPNSNVLRQSSVNVSSKSISPNKSNDKLDNRCRKRGRRQRNKNTRDVETSTSNKEEEVDADSKNDPFASHPLVKLQAKRRQCLKNIENGEAINDNQHLCELSNHVVNNTVSNNSQTSSICETLTPSTSTSEEAWKPLNQKHKLRSIESLCEVMLLDGIPTPFTNENTDCVACKLRNHVQTETVIRMVCAACPEFPRLCSAQCFRWWHNIHLPALRNKPRTIIESEQTGTTIKKSNNQVMVSEFQVLDQSSELKAPEKSVPQPCTASVHRLVGKRKRRKRFLYSNAKRKVIPV
ncbi:unnamed protein product [Trichobilharzia szidati]|nr:unnamed protein product [Trichobilharzia szidati]